MNPEIWGTLATIGGVVALATLIGGVVLRRFVTPYLRSALGEARTARQEMQRNDGHSVQDSIDRIEKAQKGQGESLDHLRRQVDETRHEVSRLAGQQDVILTLLRRQDGGHYR